MGILTIEQFEDGPILNVKQNVFIAYIDILECHNPYCGCGNFEMVCITKQEQDNEYNKVQSYSFEGNVFEQSIALFDDIEHVEIPQYRNLLNYLDEYLQTDDWDSIYQVFKTNKANRINEIKIDEFKDYQYIFDEKHIVNETLRIQFNEIFPWYGFYIVHQDGVEYELIEQYCKTLDCDCSLMNFSLFINKGEYYDDFDFDYKSGQIYKDEYAWVIDQLYKNYENLNLRLEHRNLKVRYLYGKAMVKPENLFLQQEALIKQNENLHKLNNSLKLQKHALLKQFGRNAPCPCGSGKKFKKCCLNKYK